MPDGRGGRRDADHSETAWFRYYVCGNKRIGFTAAVLFLELNEYRFGVSEIEATVKALGLAAREIGEHEYAICLAENSLGM